MGYYIRRPVENAVERIIDKQTKLRAKYPDPEQMMVDIEKALEGKTKKTLTSYDKHLLNVYFEIWLVLNPSYEGEYYNCR